MAAVLDEEPRSVADSADNFLASAKRCR
jgi:hypothetical protein